MEEDSVHARKPWVWVGLTGGLRQQGGWRQVGLFLLAANFISVASTAWVFYAWRVLQ